MGSQEEKNENGNCAKVDQIEVQGSQDIVKLIDQFANMGFNAKRLANACQIYLKMLQDPECKVFFALAGAMVPAGLQRVIYDFVKEGFVDVLVTTGANITHDIAEALGQHHLQGHSCEDVDEDNKLHEAHMNRIYDVFMPNDIYETMEDWVRSFKIDPKLSVIGALWELGKNLPQNNISFLKLCAEKQIPIYCPAFTDSGIGMQLSFAYPNMNLNFFADLKQMINTAWDAKSAGVFIVGGGVPKNFIFQAMQFSPNSAKYVVQITTDSQVSAGGLSSASLSEAVSWGKINVEATTSQVHADATIILPLVLSYLKYHKQIGSFKR